MSRNVRASGHVAAQANGARRNRPRAPEEIEGRTDKVENLVLKTCYLKKA